MDLRNLLGKLTLIEGTMTSAEKNPTGPKFTGQWKGTDAGTPGNKMVGGCEQQESILKDLNKGPKPKTKEQDLAEQFEQFLQALEEDNLGVEEKRPGRTSDRPRRDYGKTGEPSKRYKQVDEHNDPWEVDQQGRPVGWKAQEDEKDRAALAAHAKKYPNGDPRVKPLTAKDALGIAQKELNQAFGKKDTDESRGHKIVATKLKDIERTNKPLADVDLKTREEQAKADYRKYVEKMKKINPNYVPMYKMDEAGANPPQGTAGQTMNDPAKTALQAKNVQQATQAIKSATQSAAPTTNIAKALDAASQGKPVGQADMKAIEPLMKDMATVAQDPKLASEFKNFAQKVQQSQRQQQTQQTTK